MFVSRMAAFVVRADQQRKHRGQQHKHEGLNQTDQYFKKIKRNRNQPIQRRNNVLHGFQHVFTSINITEKTEAERYGTEQNRNDFQNSDDEKDDDHHDFHETL